ncbi:hypothetical protein CA11_53100 [Gimesia maris]|uniref:hypothetical protein n=1 Tax=Gimesia maris TaxID=122 RepID=UPI00118BBC2C|nr:hypothetical protein [Gimesia maris]QDU17468.1 hypothetical protein CA11_53100 [Gimesia maris]
MTVEEQLEDDKSPSPAWLVLAVIIVIVILIIFWFAVTNLIYKTEQQGQFGDMFGAANTLFSGLAFAGIIYTILLQRTELKLQRKELSDTREELTLSRKAHQISSKIMAKQLMIEEVRYRDLMHPYFIADERTDTFPESLIKSRTHFKIKNVGRSVTSLIIRFESVVPSDSKEEIISPPLKEPVVYEKLFDSNESTEIVIEHSPETDAIIFVSLTFHSLDGKSWESKSQLYFEKGEFSHFLYLLPHELDILGNPIMEEEFFVDENDEELD